MGVYLITVKTNRRTDERNKGPPCWRSPSEAPTVDIFCGSRVNHKGLSVIYKYTLRTPRVGDREWKEEQHARGRSMGGDMAIAGFCTIVGKDLGSQLQVHDLGRTCLLQL